MEERPRPARTPEPFRASFFVTGGEEEADFFAGLRQRFGDEVVDQMLRSRELMRDLRPLTEDERSV